MAQTILYYDVLHRLGEGAHSLIYAVNDRQTGQVYALKHVVRTEADDFRYIDQVQNEYDVSRNFASPFLRRSIDLKVVRNLPRTVTEAFLVTNCVAVQEAQRPADMAQVVTRLEMAKFVRQNQGHAAAP